ncbi:hypothetical protein GCM10028804_34080 [Larkinella terrae]
MRRNGLIISQSRVNPVDGQTALTKSIYFNPYRFIVMDFLSDILGFLSQRKKWWLAPIILLLLLIGVILVIGGGSAVAPFIYTLF